MAGHSSSLNPSPAAMAALHPCTNQSICILYSIGRISSSNLNRIPVSLLVPVVAQSYSKGEYEPVKEIVSRD
jgi:hypothetical protein